MFLDVDDVQWIWVPRGIESFEKYWIFCQHVHKALKKYGNSKFSHFLIFAIF